MPNFKRFCLAAAMFAAASATQAQVAVKHIQTEKAGIASGVWVGDLFYLSGQTASPITPADPVKGTPADFGDTKAQAANIFAKIQKLLQDQGLDMKDVVKMTVFLGADPKTGKMDFAAMNSEYAKYFGTKDQPNKPARSAVQVANLVSPTALLEIEVIAAKGK